MLPASNVLLTPVRGGLFLSKAILAECELAPHPEALSKKLRDKMLVFVATSARCRRCFKDAARSPARGGKASLLHDRLGGCCSSAGLSLVGADGKGTSPAAAPGAAGPGRSRPGAGLSPTAADLPAGWRRFGGAGCISCHGSRASACALRCSAALCASRNKANVGRGWLTVTTPVLQVRRSKTHLN